MALVSSLRLPEINRAKTRGIITTRRVSKGFTETLEKCDSASLTHLSGCDFKAWKHPEVNLGLFLSGRVLRDAELAGMRFFF